MFENFTIGRVIGGFSSEREIENYQGDPVEDLQRYMLKIFLASYRRHYEKYITVIFRAESRRRQFLSGNLVLDINNLGSAPLITMEELSHELYEDENLSDIEITMTISKSIRGSGRANAVISNACHSIITIPKNNICLGAAILVGLTKLKKIKYF